MTFGYRPFSNIEDTSVLQFLCHILPLILGSDYSTALITLLHRSRYCTDHSNALVRIVAVYALKLTFLRLLGELAALCATILAQYPLKALKDAF
jgi:hypothetical protein